MYTGQSIRWIGVVVALSLCQAAPAATQINAANFVLSFDETQPGAALWGTPTVSNNRIAFPNAAFLASTAGVPFSAGSFRFTLTAQNGLEFGDLDWLERGLYGVAASDALATNLVTAAVTVRLLQTGSDIELGTAVSSVFDAGPLTTETLDAPWSLSQSLHRPDPWSQLDIEISNGLVASKTGLLGSGSGAGGGPDVSISTDFAELQLNVVPLPPAALLFAGAMAAVGGFARRRPARQPVSRSA